MRGAIVGHMADVVAFESHSGSRKQPGPEVARLAARQGGVVAVWQLYELDIKSGMIKSWVRSGRLHGLHIGVYSLGHRDVSRKGKLWAALLACGPDAVLSHRSAAALWGIRPTSRKDVDVTVPGRSRHKREGIDPHLVRNLDPRDVTKIDGIPVTTLARTLLDLAEVVPQDHLARAIEEAERKRLFDLKAVNELLERSPGRRGRKALSVALTDAVIEPMSRSDLERMFLKLCRQAGFPRPLVNTLIEGHEVDFIWPDKGLIVEIDSYAYHHTRKAFETDRQRDAHLQIARHRVVRVGDRWLATRPDEVAATLRALRNP
jgi:very-short-patch-repair endonuclease